jgi:murein DD-endopeptidase MepM/ murein hydrolase activator NlpD
MAPADTPVVAPEDGKITRFSGHDPKLGGPPGGPLGWSIYMDGKSGKKYFLTHLGSRTCRVGDRVTQGQQIATVADGPASWSQPHCHMGTHA